MHGVLFIPTCYILVYHLGIVARVDTMRTGFPPIYYAKCEVLITKGKFR